MKYAILGVVLAIVTGVNLVFSGALYGPAEAARSPEAATAGVKAARITQPVPADRDRGKLEGDAINTLLAAGTSGATSDGSGLLLARTAANCGDFLRDKAKRQAGNKLLLRQAAAHYRACLTHEKTAHSTSLFRETRQKLADIERQLNTRPTPVVKRPTGSEAKAALVTATPAPAVKTNQQAKPQPHPITTPPRSPQKTEEISVGPDGVIYKREK